MLDVLEILGFYLKRRLGPVLALGQRVIDHPVFGWFGPLVLIAIGLWLYAGRDLVRTQQLTITAGSETEQRHRLTRDIIVPTARQYGLDLKLVPTEGSEAALDKVNEGTEFQLALVQGHLSTDGRSEVRQVASLYIEPLHLLLKREVFDAAREKRSLKAALLGKRVDVGAAGNGTATLASTVLARLGMSAKDYVLERRTEAEMLAASAKLETLPDAVFVVSLLPAPIIERLVVDFDYRLYPLAFANAYRLEDNRVYPVSIPAYTYSMDPPIPETDLQTIGTRMLLVAHRSVQDEAIFPVLDAIYKGPFAHLYTPALKVDEPGLVPEFPLHPGTVSYINNRLPVTRETIKAMEDTWKAFLTFVPPSFFLLRRQFNRQKGEKNAQLVKKMQAHMNAVSDIEQELRDLEAGLKISVEQLIQSRRRLSEIKLQALRDYEPNNPVVAAMMPSFLSHANDIHSELTALLVSLTHPGDAPEGALPLAAVTALSHPMGDGGPPAVVEPGGPLAAGAPERSA